MLVPLFLRYSGHVGKGFSVGFNVGEGGNGGMVWLLWGELVSGQKSEVDIIE